MNMPGGPRCICPEHFTGKHCQRGKKMLGRGWAGLGNRSSPCLKKSQDPQRPGMVPACPETSTPLCPQRSASSPSFSGFSMRMKHGIGLSRQVWPSAGAKVPKPIASHWPARVSEWWETSPGGEPKVKGREKGGEAGEGQVVCLWEGRALGRVFGPRGGSVPPSLSLPQQPMPPRGPLPPGRGTPSVQLSRGLRRTLLRRG